MEAIVQNVTRRYERAVWWLDRDDVEQEARTAILAAAPKYDPRVGVPREAYDWIIARRAVGRMLWGESAPVWAAYGAGRGLIRAALDEDYPEDGPGPDEVVDLDLWRMRIQARLWELAQRDPVIALGLDVILLEVPPRLYAEKSGLSRNEVYECTRAARDAVALDPELFALWAERP